MYERYFYDFAGLFLHMRGIFANVLAFSYLEKLFLLTYCHGLAHRRANIRTAVSL